MHISIKMKRYKRISMVASNSSSTNQRSHGEIEATGRDIVSQKLRHVIVELSLHPAVPRLLIPCPFP